MVASSLLFWSQIGWVDVAFASAAPNRNVILDNAAIDYSSFTTVKRSDGKWLVAYVENYNKVKVSVVDSENDFLTKTNEVQKNATDLLTVTGNLSGSTPYDNLRLYQTKSGKLLLFVQEYGDGVTKPYTLKVYESQNKLGTDFTYKHTIFTGEIMAGPVMGRISASIGNPVELENGRLLVPVTQPKMSTLNGAHMYSPVVYVSYTDDGENWNTSEITPSPTQYAHPKGIAIQSDGIYIMSGHSSITKETAFHVSRDNGVTWSRPIIYEGTKTNETFLSYVIHGTDGNNYMAFGDNGKYKLYKRSDSLPVPNDADFFKMGTPVDPTLSGTATWEYMMEWNVEGSLENLYNIGNRLFSVFSWTNTVTGKKYVVTQDIMPTTALDTTPPNEISGFTYGSDGDSISLFWHNPIDLDFQKVEIYRNGVKVKETSDEKFVDTSLPSNTNYTYVLKTVDTKGNVSNGTTYVARTKDKVPPGSISNITENHDHESVQISWHNPNDSDFEKVEVYRDGVLVGTVQDGKWHETGLEEGKEYQYEFVAIDKDGNKSPSSGVSVTTSDITAPSEVTNVTHTITDTSISLSWDNPVDSDFQDVQIKVDGTILVDHLPSNTYTLTGLTPDKTYNITISTRDTSGNLSSGANLSLRTVDSIPPSDVSNVTTTSTHNSVSLSWNNPTDSDFSHVIIIRNGVEIATITGESYQDNNLNENTNYTYVIQSVDDAGNTANGVTKTVKTKDIKPPSEISNLQYAQESDGLHFSWNNPTDSDFKEVKVYRDGVEIQTVYGFTYTDSGVQEKKAYQYKFVTVDSNGNASNGANIQVTTQDITAPNSIASLYSSTTTKDVTFSWRNPVDSDFQSVEIFKDGIKVTETNGETWRDAFVTEKKTYTYSFIAKDTSGNVSSYVTTTVTIQDGTPPNEISNLQYQDEKTGIKWSWTLPIEDDFDHVDIYRNNVKIGTTKTASFVDKTVKEKQTYTYRFVAVDSDGNASNGILQFITVSDKTAPSGVSYIKDVQKKGTITLSWTLPNDDDIKHTLVYRNGELLGTVKGNQYSDNDIKEKNNYTYRFLVVDESGNSSSESYYAVKTNDYTPPQSIANLRYTQGKGALYLSWNMPSDDDVSDVWVYRNGTLLGKVKKGLFADTTAKEKQTYNYRFIVVDTSGNQSYETKKEITLQDMTNPNPVENIVVETSDTGLSFSWSVDKNDIVQTILFKNGVEVLRTNGTVFQDDISENGTYQYEFMTIDESGNLSARIPLSVEWKMKEIIVPPNKEEQKPILPNELPKVEVPKEKEEIIEKPVIKTPHISIIEMEKVLETVKVKPTKEGVKITWEKPKTGDVKLVVYRDGVKIGETKEEMFVDRDANPNRKHEYKFVLLAGETSTAVKHKTVQYDGEKTGEKKESKEEKQEKKQSSSQTWIIWGMLVIIVVGTIFMLKGPKNEE